MGAYYFKELQDQKLEVALKKAFIKNDQIRTDEDISNFVAKEQMIKEPLDGLQYKIIMVPDFSQTESVWIMKFHHSIGDGITCMAVTS